MGVTPHLLIPTILAALVFVYASHRLWPGRIEKAISWFVSSLIIVVSLCILMFDYRDDVKVFVLASVSTFGGLWFCFFSSMNLWGFWQDERRKVDETLRNMLIWEGPQHSSPKERGRAQEFRSALASREESNLNSDPEASSAATHETGETHVIADPLPRETEKQGDPQLRSAEKESLPDEGIRSDVVPNGHRVPHDRDDQANRDDRDDKDDRAVRPVDDRTAGERTEASFELISRPEPVYPAENIVSAIQSIEAIDAAAHLHGKGEISCAESPSVPTGMLPLVEAVEAAGNQGQVDAHEREPRPVPDWVRVKCPQCERRFTLERDALVSAVFQVISKPISDASGKVYISPDAASPDVPDLIAALEWDWASLDSNTVRSQIEAVKRIRTRLEAEEPRWWKCYHCDKVHCYQESLISQERSIETSGPFGS